MTLPNQRSRSSRAKTTALTVYEVGGCSGLAADQLNQFTTAALKDEYDVLTALNGHDDISLPAKYNPDLIILNGS